mgnify:CR=1 FL=1
MANARARAHERTTLWAAALRIEPGGFALGEGFRYALGVGATLAIGVGLAAWAVYAVFQANYAHYCVFLSAFVVLLLDVVKETPSAAAIDRALDTTLGAILALLIVIATRPLDEGTARNGTD